MLVTVAATLLLSVHGEASYRDQYPMPSFTVPSGWGVNVNLRDMDEESIDAIAATGAKWIRLDLLWSRVEQKAGVYDFSKFDPVIDGVTRRGIRPLLILNYGNKVHNVDAPRTREGRAAFANYAAAAVKRYRQRGVIWEIWNEPNLKHFWRGAPSADEYAALCRVVVPAIREVSADEWIIVGSTSRFDWPFLEKCFEEGVLKDVDGVSIHPYRDKKAPETVREDWQQLKTMLARYSPARPMTMICSEWGYSTYSGGVSERDQGQLAMRQYLSNLSSSVPLTIWYSWRDRAEASSEKEQHFGLIETSMRPKASRESVAEMLSSLSGYTFEGLIDLGEDEDQGLVFKKGMDRKLAAWTSAKQSKSIRLPAKAAWFAPGTSRQIGIGNDIKVYAQKGY
jgi:polysaccharide biosynthesis protein PslG